jgi:hypothetical protein
MSDPRVRVLVGEGQPARKGLLRFVLENEGFEVVAEAGSTMELAQQLAIHRPEVVVLDEGIDVGAVGMLHEVHPTTKVVLVWPRGVTAIGADARLEPSEVMHALGSTVARLSGGNGSVMTIGEPQRTALRDSEDVVVVPEPEPEPEPAEAAFEPAAPTRPLGVAPRLERRPMAPPSSTVFPPETRVQAPRWTYATPAEPPTRRSAWLPWLVAAFALVAMIGLAVAYIVGQDQTVPIRTVVPVTPVTPAPNDGTFTVPGTYAGVVTLRASGTIRMRGSGRLEIRLDGTSRVIARGPVKVAGDGVVRQVSGRGAMRVRGSGAVRLFLANGAVRIRIDGSIVGSVDGTVRVGGEGSFLIHRQPA